MGHSKVKRLQGHKRDPKLVLQVQLLLNHKHINSFVENKQIKLFLYTVKIKSRNQSTETISSICFNLTMS